LTLANGQLVDVGTATFSDNREFMTFNYGGNNEALEPDATVAEAGCNCTGYANYVYTARVFLGANGAAERAEIREK
jgi:hypothetical protein